MSSKQPNELADYPVVISLPIQWGDQDSFGHVNNTIHIRWFESARVEYMAKCGLDVMLKGGGVGPILASITCHYRLQMNFPDTVHVGARIGRSSMTMEHAAFSEAQQAIGADGHSTVVVFDYSTNRPTRVPDNVRQAIEQLEGKSFK